MIQNLRISCKSDLTGVQLDSRNNSVVGLLSGVNSIATENNALNFNRETIKSNS